MYELLVGLLVALEILFSRAVGRPRTKMAQLGVGDERSFGNQSHAIIIRIPAAVYRRAISMHLLSSLSSVQ